MRKLSYSFLVLLCCSIAGSAANTFCPSGWQADGFFCYFFSNETEGRSHTEGTSYCQQYGAELVEIGGDAENTFVLTNGPLKYDRSFWIGYKRVSGTLWRWPSGTAGSAVQWDLGEPDGDGDCARIVKHNSGSWRDFDCSYKLQWSCRKNTECGPIPLGDYVDQLSFLTAVTDTTGNGTYPLGTVARQTCASGYEYFSGASTNDMTCDIGSTWATVANCDVKRCIEPPTFEKAAKNGTDREFGTVIGYTCEQGYWFSPAQENMTLTLYCSENKTWVGGVDDCRKKECERPVTGNAVATSSFNYLGIEVMYTCNRGFRYDGINETVRMFTCGSDGWYPKPVIVCVILRCPVLNVQNTVNVPNNNVYGTRVGITCVPGMRFSDTTTVKYTTCLETERWDVDVTDYCQPVPCQGSPSNATNTISTYNSSKVYYSGDIVNYTCITDTFFTNGDLSRFAVCNAVAEWEPATIGACVGDVVEIAQTHYHVATESDAAETFGSIALIVIAVVLIAVVIFDLATLGRHLNLMKTNLNCGAKDEAKDELVGGDDEVGTPNGGFSGAGESSDIGRQAQGHGHGYGAIGKATDIDV